MQVFLQLIVFGLSILIDALTRLHLRVRVGDTGPGALAQSKKFTSTLGLEVESGAPTGCLRVVQSTSFE